MIGTGSASDTVSAPPRWPFYSPGVESELLACLRHGDLGSVDGHPAITLFEREFRSALCSDGLVAFFNSGTSAYTAALFALELEPGTEVIVPRRTFRATVTPLLQFGLVPRFVDCDQSDGCISIEATVGAIGPRTRAIVVTHQWGQPADVLRLRDLADRHGLKLVEDCSHAHGTRVEERPVGTVGDVAFFSCGTTKLVSGGTGGILTTARRELYERALLFGQPKRRCNAEIRDERLRQMSRVGAGVNLRGNPFAAVLAIDHLTHLRQIIDRKNENIRQLDEVVSGCCRYLRPMPRAARWTDGTWYKRPYFVVDGHVPTLIERAKALGLDLASQDAPLDHRVVEIAKRFGVHGVDLRPVPSDTQPIVVLGTRDLHGDRWDRDAYASSLEHLVG